MALEQLSARSEVRHVGRRQLEIADDAAMSDEQMELVAEDCLLLRAAVAEGCTRSFPIRGGLRHVRELYHRNRQAIDDALCIPREIQLVHDGLAHPVDHRCQSASPPIEASAVGLDRA